jgi:hypothetical protein
MSQSESPRILLIKRRNIVIVYVGVVCRTITTTYCFSFFFFFSFSLFLFISSYQSNFMATFERVKINNMYILVIRFFFICRWTQFNFDLSYFFLLVENKGPERDWTNKKCWPRKNGKKIQEVKLPIDLFCRLSLNEYFFLKLKHESNNNKSNI